MKAASLAIALGFALSSAAATPDSPGLDPVVAAALRSAYEQAASDAASKPPQEAARSWADFAMLLHAQSLHRDAEDAYGEAVAALGSAEPSDELAKWQYLLGVVHLENGDISAARGAFRASVDDDAYLPARLRLLRAELLLGNIDAAGELAGDLLREAPDAAVVLAAAADVAIERERWIEARDLLERGFRLEPGAGLLAFKLARVHRALGDAAATSRWLSRRNDKAPVIDDPWLAEVAAQSLNARFFARAGERALERNDGADALESFARAESLDPENPDFALGRALALAQLGRRDEAVTIARSVLASGGVREKAEYVLAFSLRLSQPEEALRVLAARGVSQTMDENRVALLGALAIQADRLEIASEAFDLLVARSSQDAYAHFWKGFVAAARGSCDDARTSATRAVQIEPRWGQARVLAWSLTALCGLADERQRTFATVERLHRRQLESGGSAAADLVLTLALLHAAEARFDAALALTLPLVPNTDAIRLADGFRAGRLANDQYPGRWTWLPREVLPTD